jgi:biopolymer transport protein ExbD
LLLLFFLLTTTFRTDEGVIPSMLPKGGGPGPGPVDVPGLSIYVNPEGDNNLGASFKVGQAGQSIQDAQQLYERLAAKKYDDDSMRSKMPVTVRARGDVRWQFVMEAYNQARRANFSTVTIHKES